MIIDGFIMGEMKRVGFWFVLLLLIVSLSSYGADFSAQQGYTDNTGGAQLTNGRVLFSSTSSRWFWHLDFTQPGSYAVSAKVLVPSAPAGLVLRVGDYIPQFGEGSAVEAALNDTGGTSQWVAMGDVIIGESGLHYIFARSPEIADAQSIAVEAIRLEGPGSVTLGPAWTGRAKAAFYGVNESTSSRRAKYTEMVPRPWPIPAIGGTHTVMTISGSYSHNNSNVAFSLWQSNNLNPTPLVANGGTRIFTHEGEGSTITLNDFYLDPQRQRKVMALRTPDGSNTITTICAGEVGQRWYLVGRMREYANLTLGSGYGFIENFSKFNAHYYQRSCAWGNSWSYGDHGGGNSWLENISVDADFKTPNASYPPPYERDVYTWGDSRMRQDMVEIIIGGQLFEHNNGNPIDYALPAGREFPEMPSLNLVCTLNEPEEIYQVADAQIGIEYSANLFDTIRDPHSDTPFEYEKLTGPDWLTVNANGQLGGTPGAGNTGQNVFTIEATAEEMGLEGQFTVGIYAAAIGNNAPVFVNPLQEVQTAATMDDSVAVFAFHDPDTGDSHTLSITAGNTGGVFGIDQAAKSLIKTAVPSVGVYQLSLTLTDDGSPSKTATTDVDVVVVDTDGKDGATKDIWYITAGETLADLKSDPRYPDNPDWTGAVRDFIVPLMGKMTGYRVRGYLYPPAGGSYQFYYSDNGADGEFWLSTDESPTNLIVLSSGSTVTLSAGQRYYFEALSKSANGNTGSFQVEWEGPGISQQIVPGTSMSPVEYVRPDFGQDTIVLRDVLTGESYREDMRSKLKTLDMFDVVAYEISGPAWLTVSSDGILTGTPAGGDTGTNLFTLRATAPGGLYDEIVVEIQVNENQTPQFSADPIVLPSINEDVLLDTTINQYASDSNVGTVLGFGDHLSFSKVSGPDWMHVDEMGRIYGKPLPVHAGLNILTARATDIGGLTTEAQVHITVNAVENPPVIQDIIERFTYNNQWIEGSLSDYAYDLDGDALTFSKISGPSWLTIQVNGSYFGRPGAYSPLMNDFVVHVSDGTGGTDQGTLKVYVLPDFRIAYEGFEGSVGDDINETNGGTGWAGPWNGDTGWDFASDGLEFPDVNDVTGLKAAMGGQGTTITRSILVPVTVGSGTDEVDEIWIATMMDLHAASGIAPGHSIQLKLFNSGQIGYFGKGVNKSIGFDLGGWHEVSGGMGIGNGTAGLWFMVLHLKANGNNTEINFYATKDSEPVDISDPGSFAHTASANYPGKIVIDGIGMYRWNNTESFIDEICLSQWYETIVEKMIPAVPPCIAYEPFDGADGTDVDTTTGGTGWTGAWSDTRGAATQFVFSDPGLTFGDLETSGLKATYLGNGTGGNTRYSRSLGSAITVDASNPELWASYLLDLNEINSGRGCGVELTNGGTPVVGFGKGVNRDLAIGEGGNLGVQGTAINVAPLVVETGATFFVLKLAFDGTDTVATVYAAKSTETGFDISDVGTFGGSATITLSGSITIDGVNLFGYHGSTVTNSMDEIVLARQYDTLIGSSSPQDQDPPIPNPSSLAELPYPTGSFSVSMKAKQALDSSGTEYYFACSSGDGHDSGWQNSPVYTDNGLQSDVQYSYTVKTRDLSPAHHETAASNPATVVINLYDGKLGIPDFAFFAQQWLQPNCGFCAGADLTGDENVDMNDLFIFAQNWPGL